MNEATADATRAAIGRAGGLTVYELFAAQARDRPSATAITAKATSPSPMPNWTDVCAVSRRPSPPAASDAAR